MIRPRDGRAVRVGLLEQRANEALLEADAAFASSLGLRVGDVACLRCGELMPSYIDGHPIVCDPCFAEGGAQ